MKLKSSALISSFLLSVISAVSNASSFSALEEGALSPTSIVPQSTEVCTFCMDDAVGVPASFSDAPGAPQDAVKLACNHVFHRGCIDTWVYEYDKYFCPNCRTEITPVLSRLSLALRYQMWKQRHAQALGRVQCCLCTTVSIGVGAFFVLFFYSIMMPRVVV